MKLVNPSFQILEQGAGLEGVYEMIETAGRTCYKSTRPEGQTAKDFVDRMIASKHYAMLEHGAVYLTIPAEDAYQSCSNVPELFLGNPYTRAIETDELDTIYVTTNLRVLVENGMLEYLRYLCEPTEYHEKRVTVKFTTSNSIMREFTRHRSSSFAVESTRYCNYSKDRFDAQITFIKPYWFKDNNCVLDLVYPSIVHCTFFPEYDYEYKAEYSGKTVSKEDMFLWSLMTAEKAYLDSIKLGATPQEAREILPLATKCDMIMTGFVSDWEHLFNLRTSFIAETGKPHPDMSALCDPLYNKFRELNYI